MEWILIIVLFLIIFCTSSIEEFVTKAYNSTYELTDTINPFYNKSLESKERLIEKIKAKYPNPIVVSGLIDYNINLPFPYSKKSVSDNVIKELNFKEYSNMYIDTSFKKIYTDNYGIFQLHTQFIDFQHFFALPVVITVKILKQMMYLMHISTTNNEERKEKIDTNIKAFNYIFA